MRAAALLFALLAGAAQADTTIGLHLGSQHYPARDLNNVNPGVYVLHDGWTAGVYRNSYRRPTVYGGYSWNLYRGDWVRLDLTAAVATGYRQETGQALRPIVLPSVAFGGDTRVRISYGARPNKRSTHVVHLSIERSL
ncbi:hypothetical protein [Eleftheria terrae]|uniref:hypothetical protein n=1 Tax=Eleftheria terrae TaxID=1597781 RepID=UPI00263B9EFE|nr:hypothetical protein [Eleftheria terrae]WKB52992.1 hypothetical protein N7L95_00895 [Eleftheria terrae]